MSNHRSAEPVHSVQSFVGAAKIGSTAIALWGLTAFAVDVARGVEFEPLLSGMILGESSATWGDYDNDGDLDVLSPNAFSGIPDVYRNDAGVFVDVGIELAEVTEPAAAWGDYDNDGDLDVLLAGRDDLSSLPISRVYRNDGGTFVDIGAGLAGVFYGSVAWGDYDNDGDLDILLAGEPDGGGFISNVYRNDSGSFVDIGAGLTGVVHPSVAWGDYDNDLDLDVLITGQVEVAGLLGGGGEPAQFSAVYRNDGGSFIDITAGLTPVESSAAAWGDYDGDGDLDILLAGQADGGTVSQVYRNDAGAFTDISAGLPAIESGAVAWGDHDNDGDLDILLTGSTDSGSISRIYVNDAGTFIEFVALPDIVSGIYRSSAAWGDFDNDGDLDILFSGDNSPVTDVYRSDASSPNLSPGAPDLFPPVLASGSTTFSWSAGDDDTTPVPGLSYNLRMGTTPGGFEIFSGMVDAASGYRRVPAIGNVNHNLTWTWSGPEVLALLQDSEILYWSVQTIDAAFAGSAPSPEREYSARPHDTLVTDVGGDQGRQVRLEWTRSAFDLPVTGHAPITGYSIWRHVEPGTESRSGGNRAERRSAAAETWDYVLTVPARAFVTYSVVAPTLCDSTEAGICYSTFMISAMTSDPTVFYDSVPSSGYSVDNLAPAVPMNLRLEATFLEWDESNDDDFRNFSVYGSESVVFDDTAILVADTIEPLLDVSEETASYFHVTASDFAGNEGDAASIGAVTGVPGSDGGLVTRFELHPPQPNPSRGPSTIRFDLPRTELVDLRIFDVSGRLMNVLASGEEVAAGQHDVVWNGGHLASGIYFVRLRAGDFSATRRLHLAR